MIISLRGLAIIIAIILIFLIIRRGTRSSPRR